MTAAPSNPSRLESGNSPSAAHRVVAHIADLIRRCDALGRDRRDRLAGWQIDYAVDADIVNLYLRPREMLHYAEVFDGDEQSEDKEALAELLGRYIVGQSPSGAKSSESNGAGPLSRLLIVSPHDEELDRIRLAIARKVMDEKRDQDESFDELVDRVISTQTGKNQEDLAGIAKHLAEHLTDLVAAYDGLSGPQLEMNRFNELPADRLYNIRRMAEYSGVGATGLVSREYPALLPPVSSAKADLQADFQERIDYWSDLLRTHRTGRAQRTYARKDDAQVLASLEWINDRAQQHRRRLVLITGSVNLYAAACNVPVGDSPGHTVASRYLRDPRAFLAVKDFFVVSDTEIDSVEGGFDFDLPEWLNLLLPGVFKSDSSFGTQNFSSGDPSEDLPMLADLAKVPDGDEGTHAQVQEIVERIRRVVRVSGGSAPFEKTVIERWRDIVRNTEALRSTSSEQDPTWAERAEKMVAELSRQLQVGWNLARLREEWQQRIDVSLAKLYFTASNLGLFPLLEEGKPLRGVPTFRFDQRYPRAQEQSEDLCKRLWHGDKVFDLGGMYQVLSDEDTRVLGPGDDSRYHAHLIHALAYAARGHWLATLTLCRLAHAIVRRLPPEQSHGRRGSEALYLMAVSQRRLARTIGDLTAPRATLDRAMEVEGADRRPDVRFLSEALALDVTLAQFQAFGVQQHELLPVSTVLGRAETILGALASEPLLSVTKWVHRQTVTNVCILALLHELQVAGSTAQWRASLLKLLEGFKAAALAPDSPPDPGQPDSPYKDAVSDFVYWVARAVFGENADERRRARAELAGQTNTGGPTLPFESIRKEQFTSLARRSA